MCEYSRWCSILAHMLHLHVLLLARSRWHRHNFWCKLNICSNTDALMMRLSFNTFDPNTTQKSSMHDSIERHLLWPLGRAAQHRIVDPWINETWEELDYLQLHVFKILLVHTSQWSCTYRLHAPYKQKRQFVQCSDPLCKCTRRGNWLNRHTNVKLWRLLGRRTRCCRCWRTTRCSCPTRQHILTVLV